MPRKKTTASTATTGNNFVAATAILNFFRTADLAVALFAAGLVADTIKERQNKGKAVLAGRAKGPSATETVNAATASALPGSAAGATGSGPTGVVAPRRKPGPAKGTKRGTKGAQPVAQAGDSTSGAGQMGSPSGAAGEEIVDAAALPPQEGTLDLDAAGVQ